MTKVQPSALATKAYLAGFAEIDQEYDLEVEIEGNLPKEIQGDFLQIGPRGGSIGGEKVHWFDSNGMISAWRLQNGKASFKNRFVRTQEMLKEELTGRRHYRGYFTNLNKGWLGNFGRKPKNPANAWLTDIPNGLLAGGGFGVPVELDPDTLAVRQDKPFLRRLPKRWRCWITEPVTNPENGSLYLLAGYLLDKSLRPAVDLVEVPVNGRAKLVARLHLGDIYLTHSFSLTKRFAVVPVGPYRCGLQRVLGAACGAFSFIDAAQWHANEPLKFYIVSLQNGTVRCVETSAEYPLHIINTFEQGDDVIIDCEVYEYGLLPLAQLDAARNDEPLHDEPPGGALIRYFIKPDGKIIRKVLAENKIVYPFINDDHHGVSSTDLYGVTNPSWSDSGLIRIDPEMRNRPTGIESLQFVGGGPAIVNCQQDNKSWLLCPVYSGSDNNVSMLHVYSTQFELQAILRLPINIPVSVHSHFVEKKFFP